MPTSRRSMIAATAVGLSSAEVVRAAGAPPAPATLDNRDVAELLQLSQESNLALLRGDVDRYFSLVRMADDFTLMSPFGGKPSRPQENLPALRENLRRFFRNGTLSVELVQAYSSRDLVVLALIERAHGEVGGLPAQDWPLRVTLVYRRVDSGWHLAHRHADSLVPGITLQHAASIARGEHTG